MPDGHEDRPDDRDKRAALLLERARPTAAGKPASRGPSETSYELYRETGENFRSVCVEISGDYFRMDTHDMGRATEEFWGDSDYEFWAVVKRAEWPKLLAAFAKEVRADAWASDPESWRAMHAGQQAELLIDITKVLFGGESRATDQLRDMCEKHGVECSGGSWV